MTIFKDHRAAARAVKTAEAVYASLSFPNEDESDDYEEIEDEETEKEDSSDEEELQEEYIQNSYW